MSRGTIAYLAGTFPARSETFVYREVRALRALGWNVVACALREPAEKGLRGFEDLERDVVTVYEPGWILAAIAEGIAHPIGALRTFARSIGDAIAPGEPTTFGDRAKLIAQGVAGISLARKLRARGVKHLHCHFAHAPATVGMYGVCPEYSSFSFTGHANDLFQRRILLRKKLIRAAFVSCISDWHREFYSDVFPAPRKYDVIRCGVPLEDWKSETENEGKPNTSPLRILTVGRLVEKKGVDTLLRACQQLTNRPGRRDTEWRLTIAGDGPERAKLERLTDELQIRESVAFLGAVDNDRVPALLRANDVFALACREDSSGDKDGIPVVLMEAMACGVPAIAGDLEAIRELIANRESGFLVDGSNPAALADVLSEIGSDPALRFRIGLAGRKRVEEEFSLDRNVARLVKRFEAVLKK